MDTHIVHIDLEPFLRDHVRTNVVHECLESGRRVGESEEHDRRFVEPQGSDKCCFPLVFFPKSDIIIPPTYVKLGKDGRVFHVVNKLWDKG